MKKSIPNIIPPGSDVELIFADKETPSWKRKIGKKYRVGFYSRQDGLETIWLVDDTGYCETTGRDYLLKYFKILRLSKNEDYFGDKSKPLGRLNRLHPRDR